MGCKGSSVRITPSRPIKSRAYNIFVVSPCSVIAVLCSSHWYTDSCRNRVTGVSQAPHESSCGRHRIGRQFLNSNGTTWHRPAVRTCGDVRRLGLYDAVGGVRKSVGCGQRGYVRVDIVGRGMYKKKREKK